jgi:RNA exonuclease 4
VEVTQKRRGQQNPQVRPQPNFYAMGFFITKKQKHAIKERRKKKILAEKGLLLPVQDGNDAVTASIKTKKRSRPTEDANEDDALDNVQQQQRVNGSTTTAPFQKNTNTPVAVIVPAGLSARDAKKFRKDARRKERNKGHEDVQFVIEGQEEEEKEQKQPETKKAKKRTFPCIKEIVQQEMLAHQETEVQQAHDDLSEDYKSKYVALDCEMVGIGSEGRHSALARVSIVNWSGETVLDTFVQVPTKVTDFRTFVSGVKPKHIQSTTAMNVKTCRETVAALIKGKILVGHSLKNDLHALMLQHPVTHIRDTAHYRTFQRLGGGGSAKKWRPRKLRDLVHEHCGIVIQEAGQSHDSVDDAKANMELFKTVHAAWEKELELKAQKKTSSSSLR